MARLSLYLPPFAGDYSGACSVLFGMDCLVVVVDAGCCTRNYVEYDETRWKGARKATFSAQLRTLDALLGDDSAIVEQAADTARDLGVSCVALIGTPVPALVGMDIDGMAREAEAASGIPAVGIATTGFETYEAGVARALEALARRFALADAVQGASDRAQAADVPAPRPRVNVLGATPHDFMTLEALKELEEGFVTAGLDVAFSTTSAFGPADVAAAASADASIVVSTAGLSTARLLHETFGVPYVAGRPFLPEDFEALAERVRSGDSRPLWDAAPPATADDVATPLLLVGEQVAMSSLRAHARRALRAAGAERPIVVASFFGWEPAFAEPQDARLADEGALEDWMRAHPGAAVVGDPLLRRIPQIASAPFLELPHEAVSSTIYREHEACAHAAAAVHILVDFARFNALQSRETDEDV